MSHKDKLMGLRDGQRVYAAYRIDYDNSDDVRSNIDLSGAAKSPPPGYDGHAVKDGYQRKVTVENSTTRDDVTAYLDANGVDYTVEDVAPTTSEKDAIEQWGGEHGLDAKEAIKWDNAVAAADTVADLKKVQCGEHPDTGESVTPPKKPQTRQ